MSHLSRRISAKLVAWLLLAVLLLTAISSGFCAMVWFNYGGSHDGGAYMRQEVLERLCQQYADEAVYCYYITIRDNSSSQLYWEGYFAEPNSNFAFELHNAQGELLLSNFSLRESQYNFTTDYSLSSTASESYELRESYASYEEAENRLAQLNAENASISETAWRYGITCSLEPIAEPTTDLETPSQSAGNPVLPNKIVDEGDGLYSYYFRSAEDQEQWLKQHAENYNIYIADTFLEPIAFELYALCYNTETETLTLTAKIPVNSQLNAKDGIWIRLQLIQFLVDFQTILIPSLVISCVLFLLVLIFLFFGAGRRTDTEEVHLRWCDRIPLEFLLFAAILLCCIPLLELSEIGADWAPILALATLVPVVLFCIWVLLSCAVRLKARCFWRSTIIGWLLYLLRHGGQRAWQGLKYVVQGLPLVWQIAVAWLVYSFMELLLILSFRDQLWALERLLLTPVLLGIGIQLVRLRQGAARIADGDLSTQVDLRHMRGDILRHGQDLNRITDGLQSAVEQRMRSERLKTELITNVSHDIKTPLTSIVNYVDLLSHEDMPSEHAREYLEVLKRQSARLRKLTEDLVEASKAATGNVETHPENMDVNVLLAQTTGEFEEKLRQLQLDPVLNLDEEPAMIFADGRLLWRVFDNLMNNICKYALPGTRVYLSAHRKDNIIEIVFRNISRYQLNISSDELMERFVRGDASRSTEGSGLGLSIARSLTDLQGGEFDLIVDGDLFKAIVRFPAL